MVPTINPITTNTAPTTARVLRFSSNRPSIWLARSIMAKTVTRGTVAIANPVVVAEMVRIAVDNDV